MKMSFKQVINLRPKRFEEWLRLATVKEKNKVLEQMYKEEHR